MVHYLPKIARLKSFSGGSDNYDPNKAECASGIITMVNTKASRHLNGPYFYSHYKGGGQKRWQNLSRFGHISSRLRPNQCCKEIDLSIFTALDGATGGSTSGKKVKTQKQKLQKCEEKNPMNLQISKRYSLLCGARQHCGRNKFLLFRSIDLHTWTTKQFNHSEQ